MLFGLGTRRMGRVGTWLAFVSSMVVRTGATAAVVRPGRPGGLRRGTGGGGALRIASVGWCCTYRPWPRGGIWGIAWTNCGLTISRCCIGWSRSSGCPCRTWPTHQRPTAPRSGSADRWRSAVADAGDMPELSPPMMVTGAWLRSTSSPAGRPPCVRCVAVGWSQ